jgi:hypothetical protein
MKLGDLAVRALAACFLLVAALAGLSSAVGAGAPPDRPPGVAAADWIPISTSLGLVIAHRRRGVTTIPDSTATLVAPPAEGYFMIKRGSGVWVHLVVVDPPGTAAHE